MTKVLGFQNRPTIDFTLVGIPEYQKKKNVDYAGRVDVFRRGLGEGLPLEVLVIKFD